MNYFAQKYQIITKTDIRAIFKTDLIIYLKNRRNYQQNLIKNVEVAIIKRNYQFKKNKNKYLKKKKTWQKTHTNEFIL